MADTRKFSEFSLRNVPSDTALLVGYDVAGFENIRIPISVLREGIPAGSILYNDTTTGLGADNVQDAIVALKALIGDLPIGDFNFSNPSALTFGTI